MARVSPGLVETVINVLMNDTGYTRKQYLGPAFIGCVKAAWTRDLGPRPPVPADWR